MRFLTFWIFLFIASSSLAQTKAHRQLESLELQRFRAMTEKDTAFLQEVLDAGLTYTHSNGLVETKSEHIANIQTGKLVYQSMKPEGMKVKVYGKSAVITGIVEVAGILNEKKFNVRLHYTDMYVKKKGKWRLAAWQSTSVN